MIIKDNIMFSVDRLIFVSIEEKPIFNYDNKKYKFNYIIVLHLNIKDLNTINIIEFDNKKDAIKYIDDLALIINQLRTNKLEKVIL